MYNERVYKMLFSTVYPMPAQKTERKGRTKEEVDTGIFTAVSFTCGSGGSMV
jgi:hypothetical protein